MLRPATDIPGNGEHRGPSCPCCGAFRAHYNPELAYDVLQYKVHFRQRITALYDTLSSPIVPDMPLSELPAHDNPITTIAWYAVLTDEVLVGYMLPEPES